ncbi:uncharacterized protein N7473_010912 [Penicillium subrubescens]|uniref:Uncharacterized protein n=1 Tax=Penicillium subrubescens TaxID=1316194 RepID=A0A1Q5T284_9EURO|nr:uncharacterized protein N7473_010912 [Penicillium subrubescens]KAJ5884026.1 hypothetical protein N7473_010912 [Penicillium subrubescens]OKO94368.1 hypothetical protein PENSUB_11635 [Penicillium subrubescens]
MTEIDFPDADTDSCNEQWASICTSYEKSLSTLAAKKRDLELRNDEMVRINASLNANYRVLKATISEISAEKKELVTRNNMLQKRLDYLREISGYGDLFRRQKQSLDESICAESWERNRIFGARVPVLKGDGHDTPAITVNAQAEKRDCDDRKHDTSSLELICDCGKISKVSDDNLTSIKVKPSPSTPKSCQCECQKGRARHKRAKNKTNTPAGAEDHNTSPDPSTPTSLGITSRSSDLPQELPPGIEFLMGLILLGLILLILV